jgi:hypothetical protein
MVAQCFFDNSGWDGKSPVFVMAGYIAKEKQWEEFSQEWQSILDLEEPRKLNRLKMFEAFRLSSYKSEFNGWTESERDERLKKFVIAINKYVEHAIIVAIPVEPHQRLFKGVFQPDAMGRPFFLSFFSIMTQLARVASHLEIDDEVQFFFDEEGGESKRLMAEQYELFKSMAPPAIKKIMGGIPQFKKDEQFKPLQAADMLAWLARRYFSEEINGRIPQLDPPHQFLANLFKPMHDILEVWPEEKLKNAADFILAQRR